MHAEGGFNPSKHGHRFSEPEGWEAYIPLSAEEVRRSKERNRAIWEEAIRRLELDDD